MTLILPQRLVGEIEEEARRAYPRECCGLIEGVRQGEDALATTLHPAPDGERDRFSIDPQVHFQALKDARQGGHALIGCYHSHPDGIPRPSVADQKGAGEENFLWLILALDNRDAPVTLGAWRYLDVDFEEIGWATGADLVTSSSKTR